MYLYIARWEKLYSDFYSEKSKKFNISKILDIYDNIKYDYLHNYEFVTSIYSEVENIFDISKLLSNFIQPYEFGRTKN